MSSLWKTPDPSKVQDGYWRMGGVHEDVDESGVMGSGPGVLRRDRRNKVQEGKDR